MKGAEKKVSVFRLVYNDERLGDLNDQLNVGDQVISVTIGNDGNLVLCTGNNKHRLRERPNPIECVNSPYENDLGAWIWFYIGYSRAEEKIRFYIRYDDHDWETTVSEVMHFIPHWSGVYLGGDPFRQSFQGQIREFELLYGARSYQTGLLDHLIEDNPPAEVVEQMRNALAGGLWNVM